MATVAALAVAEAATPTRIHHGIGSEERPEMTDLRTPGPVRARRRRWACGARAWTSIDRWLVSSPRARSVPLVTAVTRSAREARMGDMLTGRATTAILVVLVAIGGCSHAGPESAVPTTTQTTESAGSATTRATSSATSDPQAAAEARVLDAYRGFWKAATAAEARPARRHPELAKYATDKALAAEQATIVLYRQQGIVGRGKPKLNPQVVAISLETGTADIRDCLDLTGVDAVYRNTGESAIPPDQSRRHVATAKAALHNGRWLITELVADREQPC